MKCQNCGYESKGLDYCPVCGEKIEATEENIVKEEVKENKIDEKVEPKAVNTVGNQYKVFAIIGYVLGLTSLILVWVPFMFFDSIPGMIFSKIGDKPTNKQSYAKKGFNMSLIGTIINIVWTILFYVIIIVCAVELGMDYFD